MKKLNSKNFLPGLIILLLNSSVFITDTTSQWVLVGNGLANTTFYSLAANSNTIFGGGGISSSVVYKSTNHGTNWTASLNLSVSFYSLAANGNNIFAGSDGLGVYYSSNNGTSWTQTTLNNLAVNALIVNGNRIFAGTTTNGVYITNDNGANWTQTSLNNRTVLELTAKGDTIYAGTSIYGVYLSTDNGSTWSQTSLNNFYIHSLAVNGNNLFAGTSGSGIWRSTNNGTNWIQVGLNNQSVHSLAFYGDTVFAGSYTTGVYLSYDNGVTWTPRNEGINTGLNIRAFCILDNYIFTIPQSRIYRRPLSELTATETVSNEIPKQFSLSQNYPNPFNPVTSIEFSLPERDFVSLKMYDATGREIEVLVKSELNPGTYRAKWNAANYSSGIYFYKISAGSFTETKRMILIK